MTVEGEQQKDPAIHIYVSILPQTPFPSRLPYNTEQSSMCYTVGLYRLSILNIAVNKLMVAGVGKGVVGEFGMDVYTLLFLRWIINRVLLYSTWNSAQCYMAAWMRGEGQGEWVHVYSRLSPLPVHLKLAQCC